MALPFVFKELLWVEKAVTETKELDSEFQKCKTVVIEITTTGFSGTLDIQGKMHEVSAYSNIPYKRVDQATIQTPAVAQISFTTNTGVYRYTPVSWWAMLKLVMTRSAGTITLAVVGSSVPNEVPTIVAN